MHASRIFFLTDSHDVIPVPHGRYVQLVRGECTMAEFAGRMVRVADWYIKTNGADRKASVLNETYSVLIFDAAGNVDWSRCCPPGHASNNGQTWSPNDEEKNRLQDLAFSGGTTGPEANGKGVA